MSARDYNGWANRETWLVNLWFGDTFSAMQEDGENVTADLIESIVTEYVDEHVPPASFISDMMDMGAIDYDEIASHYEDE